MRASLRVAHLVIDVYLDMVGDRLWRAFKKVRQVFIHQGLDNAQILDINIESYQQLTLLHKLLH